MKPDAQRIAILEVLGWRWEPCFPRTRRSGVRVFAPKGYKPNWTGGDKETNSIDWPLTKGKTAKEEAHRIYRDCGPDPLNDLNAMHEAEIWLMRNRPDVGADYNDAVRQVHYGKDRDIHWTISTPADMRAEAFLRTLNLWKEDAV